MVRPRVQKLGHVLQGVLLCTLVLVQSELIAFLHVWYSEIVIDAVLCRVREYKVVKYCRFDLLKAFDSINATLNTYVMTFY